MVKLGVHSEFENVQIVHLFVMLLVAKIIQTVVKFTHYPIKQYEKIVSALNLVLVRL